MSGNLYVSTALAANRPAINRIGTAQWVDKRAPIVILASIAGTLRAKAFCTPLAVDLQYR